MLKVALLGAGRIGQVHARTMMANADTQLVAVADVVTEAADALAKTYDINSVSVDDALNDPNIDAVLIATSTDTHSDLIEIATKNGKAVLCEKPIDLSLERAIECQRQTEKNKQPIMIGFNRRFDPNFSNLKSRFDNGEIGKGELLSITSFDPAPPPISYVKVSGGLYRDMMIHDIDIACWLFGGTPAKINAVGSSIIDEEIGKAGDVDTAIATLAWADGRLATIKNSRRAAYGYDQRIELLGSEGLIGAKNVLENTVETITSIGATTAKPEHFFLERYARAYEIEWQEFVSALSDKRPMPATLQDGINALAVAEAATLSSSTGKTVLMNGIDFEVAP